MAKTLEQVYTDSEAGYKSSVIIPRFMPPDGEYTVSLNAVIDAAIQDELVVFVTGQIVDGDYAGRQMLVVRSGEKTRGFLKEAADLLLGNTALSVRETITSLKAKVAEAPIVGVEVRTSKPNAKGQTYSNARITGIVSTE